MKATSAIARIPIIRRHPLRRPPLFGRSLVSDLSSGYSGPPSEDRSISRLGHLDGKFVRILCLVLHLFRHLCTLSCVLKPMDEERLLDRPYLNRSIELVVVTPECKTYQENIQRG